jgi:hypothetical protein
VAIYRWRKSTVRHPSNLWDSWRFRRQSEGCPADAVSQWSIGSVETKPGAALPMILGPKGNQGAQQAELEYAFGDGLAAGTFGIPPSTSGSWRAHLRPILDLLGALGYGTGHRVLHSDQLSNESEVSCPATAKEVDLVPESPKEVGLKPRASPMPGYESTILDRIREFERTFEQKYGRKITNEEQRILEASKKIVEQRLGIKYLEKAAD